MGTVTKIIFVSGCFSKALLTQLAFTCSKLTTETLEQVVNVQIIITNYYLFSQKIMI